MSTLYNARADFARRWSSTPGDAWAEATLDRLAGFSPALGPTAVQGTELVFTLPADSLPTAITTALALASAAAGTEPVGLEVITTAEYDRRQGLEPLAEFLSVSQVAARLGTSRQAVLQRLQAGTLPGQRVGNAWAIPAAAIAKAEADYQDDKGE